MLSLGTSDTGNTMNISPTSPSITINNIVWGKQLLDTAHTRINSLIKMLIFLGFFIHHHSEKWSNEKKSEPCNSCVFLSRKPRYNCLKPHNIRNLKLCKTSWLKHLNNLVIYAKVVFKNTASKTAEWRGTPRKKLHANLKNSY